MKILVIGAGIVGSIYGWALTQGGHSVRHLVRVGRAEKLVEGIHLDILDKRKGYPKRFVGNYAIRAVETVENPDEYQLVIFPGHHYTMTEVLRDVVPRFSATDFLFLTQNWQGSSAIDAALPRSRYILGDAKAGGSWKDGTVVGALRSVDIGAVSAEGNALLVRVKQCFESAGIEAPVHEKMLEYLWVQFGMTAGLWPSLVRAGSFDALFADRNAVTTALAATRECFALLEKRGVDLDEYPEVKLYRSKSRLATLIAFLVIRQMFKHSEWAQRTSAHALSDPREIGAFYFDVLETGRVMDVPMPIFSSYRPIIEAFVGKEIHSAA
jgi:ketopantoate reductase